MAKNLLTAHSLTYTEQLLDTKRKVEAFRAKNPSIRVMPQIYQDGLHIGSWSDLKKWLA